MPDSEAEAWGYRDTSSPAADNLWDTRAKALEKTRRYLEETTIPAGPFVGRVESYITLAFKHIIRYAAENDFERIAWTPGEAQVDRDDLSKQIEKVEAERIHTGEWGISVHPIDNEEIYRCVDEAGIPNLIGKELAEKIKTKAKEEKIQPGDGRKIIFSGLDLKVGGDGMLEFYDKILPAVVNKYVKKWGAKVKTTVVNLLPWEVVLAPSIDVTAGMRVAVLQQGQPLFSLADALQPSAVALPAREVESVLAPDIARLRFPVRVVQSPSDLPGARSAREYPGNVRGAVISGVGYVVANNVFSAEEARFVLHHEIPGHIGVRTVLGKNYDRFFGELYSAHTADVLPYLELYTEKTKARELPVKRACAMAAEEWFADKIAAGQYRTGKLRQWFGHFSRFFNEGLRHLGFRVALPEREIVSIASRARRTVLKEKQQKTELEIPVSHPSGKTSRKTRTSSLGFITR